MQFLQVGRLSGLFVATVQVGLLGQELRARHAGLEVGCLDLHPISGLLGVLISETARQAFDLKERAHVELQVLVLIHSFLYGLRQAMKCSCTVP